MLMNRERLDAALPAYEVGERIGRGGYGVVYAARHRRIGWQAAVKVLADGDTDALLRDRFLAEATALAELDHPHIVRIHDYVEHDGLCLLIMEHVGGPMLHQRPGMTAVEACGAGLAVSDALGAVHQRGILHRDVRPENLIYTSDGTLKVVGFGTASDGASLISAASGTPAYTAPERIQGFRLGPATDVYSLGVLLYELFSGRLPFSRDLPLSALLHHHVNVPAPWLSDVPRQLAAVIDRSLSKDAGERQRSAFEFAVELGYAAAGALGPDWLDQVVVPVQVSGRVREAAHGRAAGSAAADTPQRTARASVSLPSLAGAPANAATANGATANGATANGAAPALTRAPTTGAPQTGAPTGDAPVSGAPVSSVPVSSAPVSGIPRGGAPAGPVGAPPPPDPAGAPTGPGLVRRGPETFADPSRHALLPADDLPPEDDDDRPPRRRWYRRPWVIGVATLAVIGAAVLVVLAPWSSDQGDGTPAIRTSTPRGLLVSPSGDLYLSDVSNRQVRKISRSGQVTVVAGVGPAVKPGSGGDGGPAKDAQLSYPQSLALGPNGSLYIADTAERRIRQVTSDGKIRTVVGAEPTADEADDLTNPQAAALPNFFVIATSRTGQLYIAESGSGAPRVRQLRTNGLTIVAQNPPEDTGEDAPEAAAGLEQIRSIAVGRDGRVYVADRGHRLVWGFQVGGEMTQVAGGGTLADCPSKIVYNGPDTLAAGDDGALYVGSYGLCELRNGGSARELVSGRYIDAVAAGSDGLVYFISRNTIYQRTSSGELTEVRG
ncbi:serine/threonine-protein kinase [Cryptosporangium minutisporangium]|uniref:non-specific serine/threonine protein kinase n=1 Tax=Cryptosporangium minutisporangium TaxID=113569 RepID=A0ABP6SW12_9ACTN